MKVALLIWNSRNRALLAELLAQERCEIVGADEDYFGSAVDMYIVDGPALATVRDRLLQAKHAAEPLFMPVLLIGPRPETLQTAARPWTVIDDVVLRPILKRELQARIRTLLHARGLSLRLRDSVALYEREHAIAQRLQHAVLPHSLPRVHGIRFDAHYESAGNEAKIGGDWYDAMCLDDGRIVISIGDVAGAGLEAAVTTASMRQAIRAVAQVYADPLTMLDAADKTLKEEEPGRIVTAFAGIYDPIAHSLKFASAGHPPPVLRTREGQFIDLLAQSLPLGLRMRDNGCSETIAVPAGALIVFYTDGLSEVTRDPVEGEQRLRDALSVPEITGDPRPARALKHAVSDGKLFADDVAVLTMYVEEQPPDQHVRRWRFHSHDGHNAASARMEYMTLLQEWGANAETLFSCELIFGELLGNVVRYAAGELEIALDRRGEFAVLHFLDCGCGFTLAPRLPTDLLSERGRGLFLIWTLSNEFNVNVRTDGGSHARAVLPVKVSRHDGAGSREHAVDHFSR